MKIYLVSHFSIGGKESYLIPILGMTVEERVRRAYPQAVIVTGERSGVNGEELLGISLRSPVDYPAVYERIRREILLFHLRKGVLIPDMGGTCIEEEVTIGEGTYVGEGCHLERGVTVGRGSRIGPYAYLRKGTKVGHGCHVGGFTEVKNAVLGDGTKMAHLAYVGDADVGKGCNIGCGAVFVNYDGREKYRSFVGDRVFIGSNCNLVAPVTIGDGAYVACGSTVTRDLEAEDFCIARNRETVKALGARGRFGR